MKHVYASPYWNDMAIPVRSRKSITAGVWNTKLSACPNISRFPVIAANISAILNSITAPPIALYMAHSSRVSETSIA